MKRTRTADRYFLEQKIGIKISPLITGISPYYHAVDAEAHKGFNGDRPRVIARVIAFSRLSSEDMGRNNLDIANAVAIARAKRGLYALLRGEKIHNPLCQGERL